MSNEKLKNDRAFDKVVDPASIFDQVYEFKKKMQENMSDEDAALADQYFDEVSKGIEPTIKRMNEILSNPGSKKLLMDSVKQAMKDEQWLEKLSKTSYQSILAKDTPEKE